MARQDADGVAGKALRLLLGTSIRLLTSPSPRRPRTQPTQVAVRLTHERANKHEVEANVCHLSLSHLVFQLAGVLHLPLSIGCNRVVDYSSSSSFSSTTTSPITVTLPVTVSGITITLPFTTTIPSIQLLT